MELITRRRFGKIAIASGATVAIGGLISKTVAQTPGVVILGVTPGKVATNTSDLVDSDSIAESENDEISSVEDDANLKRPVVITSFNVSNGQTKTVKKTKPILGRGEQLSGFAVSKKGALIVATTATASDKNISNRLLSINGDSVETKEVSGIAKDESLELIKLPDGSIAGVVKNKNGTGSRKIVDVDSESGVVKKRTAPTKVPKKQTQTPGNNTTAVKPGANTQVEAEVPSIEIPSELPADKEYQNVVICADGNRYAFLTDFQGDTSFVNITTGKTIPVTFEGGVWNNGFSGLVCADNNELYALGGRRYETPKFLHLVDKATGSLKRLGAFDVATIAIGQ